MIRKLLCFASLGGMLVLCLPARAFATPPAAQSGSQSAQSKSVTGKVTSIGNDKKSLSVEVGDGNSKQSMTFLIDDNTQVQGRVHVGTTANIQYQQNQDGQNVALSIAPQEAE